MKTRDLMRGDKVYETCLEDTPQVATVEEVGENHIYIGMEDDDLALLRYEPEHLGWNIKDIKPIPITEEILVTIGFDKDERLSYEFYDGYHFRLTNSKGVVVECGPIWFFHELQHALRLCGLNELADNINIK